MKPATSAAARVDEDGMPSIPRTCREAEDPDVGSDWREPVHPDGPGDPSLLRIGGGFIACALLLAGLIRLLHAA
jgi:hypothetical protein